MKNFSSISPMSQQLIWGIFFVSGLMGCQGSPMAPIGPTPTAVQYQAYDSDAPITLLYPVDWHFMLPREGILIFGEEKSLFKSEPGALFTVIRVPNSQVHGNLEGEFNHYLDFGPRRDNYEAVHEVREIMVDGQEALSIRMNFLGDEDLIPFDTNITAVETESGAIYILTETAPSDVWAEQESRFAVILGSISFKE